MSRRYTPSMAASSGYLASAIGWAVIRLETRAEVYGDPTGFLQEIANELREAEDKGRRVTLDETGETARVVFLDEYGLERGTR